MGKKTQAKKKAARRARGTGSIFADARRGGWVGRVPVGRRDGRTRYVEVRGATQGEVVAKMRGVAPPDPEQVTVGEWCDRWLAAMRQRPGSQTAYRQHVELRIRPALGAKPLKALTAWDIEEACATWDVEPNTARNTLGTLGGILQAAVRARLVAVNPARAARKPAKPEVQFDLFTKDELRRILAAGLARPDRHTFALLAATGCRIGEAIAVRPEDYDAATGLLTIARTWTVDGYGPPKSRRSLRTLLVPPEARPALAAGVPNVHYSTAVWRWRALLKELGVRQRGVHQLRHSVASYALVAGVPIPDLAKYLGDTPEELLRTYCHTVGFDVSGAISGFLKP